MNNFNIARIRASAGVTRISTCAIGKTAAMAKANQPVLIDGHRSHPAHGSGAVIEVGQRLDVRTAQDRLTFP